MAAPKGHPRWGNPLNPKKYTPEKLWTKALEYFEWVENHPWWINEQLKQKPIIPKDSGLNVEEIKEIINPIIQVPRQRAYTLLGFCIYADISHETFRTYEKDQTFLGVCARIREIIEDTMLNGGLSEVFEKGLVARKLGLIEKTDIMSGGQPLQRTIIKWGDKELEV
jgi:hypothetical protein